MTKSISNAKLAQFANVAESTIRKYKAESPELYADIEMRYQRAVGGPPQILAVTNFKGGVGKSTIAAALQNYINTFSSAIVFNIDIAQDATNSNEGKAINLTDPEINATAVDIIEALMKEPVEYIILDTPGELSEEYLSIIHYVDHFVIPFNVGSRAMSATVNTINSLFTADVTKDNVLATLVLNSHQLIKRGKLDNTELTKLFNGIIDNIESDMFTCEMEINVSHLPYSAAVETTENKQKSLSTLSLENRVAYRTALKRANELSESIINFKGEEDG
jgi:cellulose biosynthesis protein BcsQ